MKTDYLRLRTPLLTLLISVIAVLLFPLAKPSASVGTPQGKGGQVVAKPTPTPKKTTTTKRGTPARKTGPEKSSSDSAAAPEIIFWNSIKDSSNREDFKEYLKKYPNGQFADLAKNRITALEAARTQSSAMPESKPSTTPAPAPTPAATEEKESAASLSETLSWLQEKLKYYSEEVGMHTEIASIDGCKVVAVQRYKAGEIDYTYTFQLADINPDSLHLYRPTPNSSITLFLNTNGDRKTILRRNDEIMRLKVGSERGLENSAPILLSYDDEMAGRIKNAFAHAIKLCKKNEPF